MNRLALGAVAGAAGSAAWAATEPLLERAFSTTYSDVRLVGRLVSPGRLWPLTGLAAHTALGAGLGATLALTGQTSVGHAFLAMQVENAVTWPGMALVDRRHPDTQSGRWPRLLTSRRVFAQNAATRVVFALGFAWCATRLAEQG